MDSGGALSTPGTFQYFEHPLQHPTQRCGIAIGAEGTVNDFNDAPEVASDISLRSTGRPQGRAKIVAPPAKKSLSPLLLTGLMYTFTIGGAYGIEESVMGGGPLLTIASIIVIPIVMALPSALAVAEMASSVPSNAGFLMWINLAFDRAVYLTLCLLSLLLIVIDNALYPVLFSEYFCTTITCSQSTHVGLRLGMIFVTYALNILGIEAVGVTSVVLTVATVSPFALLFLTQQFSSRFYLNWPAISFIPPKVDWITFITTASWNLSGLEQAGSVAEEIQNPQSTILKALIPLIGLAFVTYIPPVLTGAGANHGTLRLEEWTTGFWSEVSYRVGGNTLKLITVAGSVLSAFGLTLSAICTTTSLIAGMAQTGVFPGRLATALARRNRRFGSYHWSLTLNTLLTALFSCLLNFNELVTFDQFLYGIRILFIFVALFVLRRKYPSLHRPFRIPLDGWKLYAAFAAPTLSFFGLTVLSMVADRTTTITCLSVPTCCAFFSWAYCKYYHTQDFKGRVVTVYTH